MSSPRSAGTFMVNNNTTGNTSTYRKRRSEQASVLSTMSELRDSVIDFLSISSDTRILNATSVTSSIARQRKNRFLKTVYLMIMALLIIFYFCIVTSVCLLMHFVIGPSINWQPYYTTLLACLSIVMLFFAYVYLHFKQVANAIATQQVENWQTSKVGYVYIGIAIAICVVCIIITMVVASIFKFWENTPDGILHVASVVGSLMCIIVLLCAWIVLNIVKPKIITLGKKNRPPIPY